MNQKYLISNSWSIIEEGYDKSKIKSSESIFSIGNGAMGQRANFEETFTGDSLQGSYIGGVYYNDKTKVGWWKNGYPKYFAKVLNSPNWIGINVNVNGENINLNNCLKIDSFKRELNMKEGWLSREFIIHLYNGEILKINTKRFLSLQHDEIGAIQYNVTPLSNNIKLELTPLIDANVSNSDSNWNDQFWDHYLSSSNDENSAFVLSKTLNTNFHVCTYMSTNVYINNDLFKCIPSINSNNNLIEFKYDIELNKDTTLTLIKFGGYVSSLNHEKTDLLNRAKANIKIASDIGFEALLAIQKESWSSIWNTSDIVIKGDVNAQQGIRFNIFQLNQTYLGKNPKLNIGPKGFTGEKYGGSTYWDTEAYCLPFYMATKGNKVALNLLNYRHNQLDKAIENALNLGLGNGSALYPMVTMNGEECHNEWEITFEEIHRNGAIVFAIYNYHRYTGDYDYILEKGIDVLISIARFWGQRSNFSTSKNKYVILGVTGPNEYENNVNNNWYTNYIAKWCIDYFISNLDHIKLNHKSSYDKIINKFSINDIEILKLKIIAENMYFPYDKNLDIFLQQDQFLDKNLFGVDSIPKNERPINQHWSWDKILRSPYIKQADVMQGFYFFEDHFSQEQLEKHFDFYEPFTVHESSLSSCIHSIQASKLNRVDKAYEFYLQTSRLDLDDYNNEVEEGLHITSMAGTWSSIVEGFGGMRVLNDKLSFNTKIPKQWDMYSFKIIFRNNIISVKVTRNLTEIELTGDKPLEILLNNKLVIVEPIKIDI